MKTRLLFIIAVTMLLFGCKKDTDFGANKFEITNEEWTISATTATLTADYTWSGDIVSIAMEVSEDEGLANASSFEASVSGNSFTVTATELKAETTYYYRMSLNTENGKVESDTKTFTTTDCCLIVTTSEVTKIGVTTATCGGNVTYEGDYAVTARGVCWSTTDNPTVSDSHTVDGSGAGAFTSSITGLTGNTTYYVRAYAISSEGTDYGEVRTFRTINPTPSTPSISITVNGVSFEMVYVEGGTFEMGATTEQGGDTWGDEYPVHSVTLDGYYIGKYEVTQELWEAVMGSNPSYFNGSQNPVERVSWNDCQEFISRLNSLTGRTFRLPTEAEWEYAARGGNKSRHYKYSGSNNIDDVAWYDDNTGRKTHPVGTKSANELGIYDMSGNVFEWCSDWYDYDYYSSGAQTNPQGPSTGSYRVLRGGSGDDFASYCRVSLRFNSDPGYSYYFFGLRLALVP